jgi:hypothetical protein
MLYLPNELVNLIYIQSIWLLVGDKKRLFKDIHQDIKGNYIWMVALHTFRNPILGWSGYK